MDEPGFTAWVKRIWCKHRWVGRGHRVMGLLAAISTIAAVAVLPLVDWRSVAITWIRLGYSLSVPLLVTLVVLLWVRGRRRPRGWFGDYLAPAEYDGVADPAPRGIQSRAMAILRDLSLSPSDTPRVIRLRVLTGGSTLQYLDRLATKFGWLGRWDIRVLIAAPGSPLAGMLGPGAHDQIRASLARLREVQRKCEARGGAVVISWRTFSGIPTTRGCLIGEQHLFSGNFVWVGDPDEGERLVEQNTRFLHTDSASAFGSDEISAFKNWFDRDWDRGDAGVPSPEEACDQGATPPEAVDGFPTLSA